LARGLVDTQTARTLAVVTVPAAPCSGHSPRGGCRDRRRASSTAPLVAGA
jgi:hypothetical protein